MWPRVVEITLGLWLMSSPFIFQHGPHSRFLWSNDLTSGFCVAALAILSFWRPLCHIHLGIVVIGVWLIGFGLVSASAHSTPASQNHIVLGLLLLMFAIIPNRASLPPARWLEVLRDDTRPSEANHEP